MRRVAEKGAGTVTEVLLVLDATTGQNGLVQARAVHRGGRAHRCRAHQARRLGQGRHRRGHPGRARHPREAGRPRRGRRRSRRVRSRRVRRALSSPEEALPRCGSSPACSGSSSGWSCLPFKLVARGRRRLGPSARRHVPRRLQGRRGAGEGRVRAPPGSPGSAASSASCSASRSACCSRRRRAATCGPSCSARSDRTRGCRTPSSPRRSGSSSAMRRGRGTCLSPTCAVVEGRVQLRGQVPHDTAREELVRVAAAIPGVGRGRRPARGRDRGG